MIPAQVCDYVDTVSDEIEYIWKAKWGAGKILFLLVRYSTWPVASVAVYRRGILMAVRFNHASYVYQESLFFMSNDNCQTTVDYLLCRPNSTRHRHSMVFIHSHREHCPGNWCRREYGDTLTSGITDSAQHIVIFILRTWAIWHQRSVLLGLGALFICVWSVECWAVTDVTRGTRCKFLG